MLEGLLDPLPEDRFTAEEALEILNGKELKTKSDAVSNLKQPEKKSNDVLNVKQPEKKSDARTTTTALTPTDDEMINSLLLVGNLFIIWLGIASFAYGFEVHIDIGTFLASPSTFVSHTAENFHPFPSH